MKLFLQKRMYVCVCAYSGASELHLSTQIISFRTHCHTHTLINAEYVEKQLKVEIFILNTLCVVRIGAHVIPNSAVLPCDTFA